MSRRGDYPRRFSFGKPPKIKIPIGRGVKTEGLQSAQSETSVNPI